MCLVISEKKTKNTPPFKSITRHITKWILQTLEASYHCSVCFYVKKSKKEKKKKKVNYQAQSQRERQISTTNNETII